MSSQDRIERIVRRYADRIYRWALIRDPSPRRAVRATRAAFASLAWDDPQIEAHVEERLIAALPPVKRRPVFGASRLKTTDHLPATFWNLAADARLALGMRVLRGDDVQTIAPMIGRTPDDVADMLASALAVLADLPPDEPVAACRACRRARFDGLVPPRGHLLSCTPCRDVLQRWDRVEHELAAGIARLTGGAFLPQSDAEAILATHERSNVPTRRVHGEPFWRQPTAWRVAAVIGVIGVVVGLIVAPRGTAGTGTTFTDPRDLLALAAQRYGAVPDGDGVLHQQFAIQLGEGGESMIGDAWTDAASPARHRMQLTDGTRVREWQIGNGRDAFRYSGSSNVWTCAPYDARGMQRVLNVINRWALDAPSQEQLRQRRWQFGPWAVGQRYLDIAQNAPVVRSLGVASENGVAVATVIAEGDPIEGSLVLKLHAQDGDLREVREVLSDNGATRSYVPWRLRTQEWLTIAEATRANVFTGYPAAERPAEVERSSPVIDMACPSWQKEYTVSLSAVLSEGIASVVGLASTPSGIDRIYLGGRRDRRQNLDPASLVLVYVGSGRRLMLRTDDEGRNAAQLLTTPSSTAIRSGDWSIWIRQDGLGWIAGIAEYLQPEPNRRHRNRSISFYAEGWSQDELIVLLGTARQLTIDDWQAQRSLIYDPGLDAVLSVPRSQVIATGVDRRRWREHRPS